MISVLPANDLEEHEEGLACHCIPKQMGGILVHNSFDGRELIENFPSTIEMHSKKFAQHPTRGLLEAVLFAKSHKLILFAFVLGLSEMNAIRLRCPDLVQMPGPNYLGAIAGYTLYESRVKSYCCVYMIPVEEYNQVPE
jgi:hypothetical protein